VNRGGRTLQVWQQQNRDAEFVCITKGASAALMARIEIPGSNCRLLRRGALKSQALGSEASI
jgi:hypothetical protein